LEARLADFGGDQFFGSPDDSAGACRRSALAQVDIEITNDEWLEREQCERIAEALYFE
jgi:hypothetical protein